MTMTPWGITLTWPVPVNVSVNDGTEYWVYAPSPLALTQKMPSKLPPVVDVAVRK